MNADEYSRQRVGAAAFEAFDRASQRKAARALHDRLVEIGFGPQAAPRLFGVADMTEIRANRAALYNRVLLPRNAAGTAARFFVLHEAQPEPAIRQWLGADLHRFLADVGAIVPAAAGWRAIAGLTWFGGRLIFTDARMFDVVWPGAEPFADYVMPPGSDSIGLLRVAPRTPGRALFDICCGAGAQTLTGADYCERVVGVDINPRALRFAQFNAAANGVDRADFVHGSVYGGVPELRFHAILSNPPFVPWPHEAEASLLFRGGGARGEDVIERIFAGAVERLEPNGFLSMVADFVNAESLPKRIAQWQRCHRQTLILLQQRYDLLEYAEGHSGHLRGSDREAQVVRLVEHFFAQNIRTLDFGYVIQRGVDGIAHMLQSNAPARRSVNGAIEAWFSAQARRAVASGDEALTLTPGIRRTYGMQPSAESFLSSTDVGEAAHRIMERIERGTTRTSSFTAADEIAALSLLLDLGFVQIREQ